MDGKIRPIAHVFGSRIAVYVAYASAHLSVQDAGAMRDDIERTVDKLTGTERVHIFLMNTHHYLSSSEASELCRQLSYSLASMEVGMAADRNILRCQSFGAPMFA